MILQGFNPMHQVVAVSHGVGAAQVSLTCDCGYMAIMAFTEEERDDQETAPALIEVAGLMDVHIMNHRPR